RPAQALRVKMPVLRSTRNTGEPPAGLRRAYTGLCWDSGCVNQPLSLEGQFPVLRRPLLDVDQPRADRFGGDPVALVEDHVGRDLDPPGVVLTRLRLPDQLVILVALALDAGGGAERLGLRDVIDEVVAGAHLLQHLAPLARFEALDREPQITGAPEVVG